ncbi:PPE domain-containing protein [Candidatus Mycobacterium methanotrophicum]|uniref:PPE family protein n=1 Tax=Candidatus Mycobacterium methanotrophicum TaxID=2943498 RepID=A0ABY4QRY7_9MYCO|nr:PPE domain-containing protein [Candidatus Mycobacterium methanotrophicum]UQX13436.1 PPE family protein [Candidatus Mycobacterium methanotrophicum]
MGGVRVDPEQVGPQIGAVLASAAAALSGSAAIPPPLPPGADPVSVAAANGVAVNGGKLSSQLVAGVSRLSEGGKAVIAALQRYVVADAQGAAAVGGSGSAAAGAVGALADIDIPSAPMVEIPNLPFDMPAALATVPAEPDVVDMALRSGAAESGMEPHAAGWDATATSLSMAAQSLHELAGGLPASWEGHDAQALSDRLSTFGQWMEHSATAASAQANGARQVVGHWSTAVNKHPRAEDYEQQRQLFMQAAARAAAGDPQGAVDAAQHEGEMSRMKSDSVTTMTSFGEAAGGVNDKVNLLGDSPRISGDGDPHLPHQPAKKIGTADTDDLLSADADAAGAGGDSAGESGQATGSAMQSAMSIPQQVADALGKSLGQASQPLQQASQAASQLGNGLGGMPSGGMPSSGMPSGGSPRNPLSKLGSGSNGLEGLGGGGGGRTMPASLPEQLSPPAAAPPPAPTTAVPTNAVPRGGPSAGGGMMPMGMMPHGNRSGEGQEIERNTQWFPDEPLVKDDVETSEPIAGQRKRTRPTET